MEAGMSRFRIFAVELAAQVALALAIGLGVSLVLAGATLVLAGDAANDANPARSAQASQARP